MKRPRLYKWDYKDETEGLLFFAQCLDELLFHHTLDSFKAPALNTHLNVLELQFLSVELVNGKIKTGALTPVLEELKNRIQTDPVLEDCTELYLEYHSKIDTSKKHPEELYSTVNALLSDIENNYWESLKRKIIETLPNKNEKKKILLLAISLAVEIELRGFDRHFLYFINFNYFFNGQVQPRKIKGCDDIEGFFDVFDEGPFEWEVIFKGCEAFKDFKDHLKNYGFEIYEKMSAEFNYGDQKESFFGQDEKHPIFISFKTVKARDRFIARKKCNRSIDLFTDICRFHDHDTSLTWNEVCVVRKKSESGFVKVKPPPAPMVRGMAPRIMSMENIERTIEIMGGKHFDSHSIFLFKKALDYHRSAAETIASENQLVSLWAALEGFLPPPKEDDGSSRITQLLNSLLPSLTLSYVEKIFKYTSRCLEHSEKSAKDLIASVDNHIDFFEKVIIVLISKEFQEVRECLFKILNKNPLLRYRCHWCHENFKSNKSILTSISRHREKLSWHIQRVYTTRNQIVHSAQSLPYLDTLIENLHSYFDILLNSVMKLGVNSKIRIEIYSSLKTLEINESAYLASLKGEKKYCDLSNYKRMLFGKDNPLNPFYKN